jgi:hypothetical protein
MTAFEMVADVSPYITAGAGLVGSLIGGGIAATVTLIVARQTREAAASGWIRDTRRDVYDRFLTTAQELLIAHEATDGAVGQAHSDFFEVYGVLQTVAERPVIDAARVYAYRLLELEESRLGQQNRDAVAQLVRRARHDAIDAMRAELGVADSARPSDDFNPFWGTDLEDQYLRGSRVRSGACVPPGDARPLARE